MDETVDRLAPVSYLFGSPDAQPRAADEPQHADDDDASRSAASIRAIREDLATWNDSWGDDVPEVGPLDVDLERVSMKALGRRSLSQRELERLLREQSDDAAAVATEIDRLTRVGLLDDEALAQSLVASLHERKGLGRTAIAAELTRRLLSPGAIAYALELVDTGDELARAAELARKRAGQLANLDRDTAVRRLTGYLARRGYSGSTLRAAVDQALPPQSRSKVRFS
ncbi:regulatory protein RecX [Salinibacterium sp. ZJ77]|uniref:regulatory protein RecX n=1 Tax=Salinibacterium sp. ZJ77 TaxID=2708337 RepID=UPI00141E1B88|nr:regulatory protein RecX [Salinibacterium sp. ZJ77]